MKEETRCLYCYQPLPAGIIDFHTRCSRKFFGTDKPPVLDYGKEQMQELAKEIVIKSIALTGVQPKLSLDIEKNPTDPKRSRFTIVGLWGGYILKPPTNEFPALPENEDVTMHMAEEIGITTALHSLIRLRSGELAYITKRFDREKKQKLPVEDMCQLTETLTEDKYRGSMERVGKQVTQFSSRPGLDAISFFETALFCFITGNADMHLKNFALLTTAQNEIILSPAYDLLSTKLAMPDDTEEMALTINARKRKLKRGDFDVLAKSLHIPEKARDNSYAKLAKGLKGMVEWISISFLPEKTKSLYKTIVATNIEKIKP
jgi:serine/threonine-protein kinase HipA